MKKTIHSQKHHLFFGLLGLYLSVVLVRFLLALLTSSFPIVDIDEFIYYNLARSIVTKGTLLFWGQSADYAYVLYPMSLSPIYAVFSEGAPFYRLLQLWNIMIMSSSVFPLFFLGKSLLESEKKAFLATSLSMLLPDFILGERIFSEALLYPLFFSLMYCAYKYISKENQRYLIWVGVLGGLLYSTKPGAMVPAAVFVVLLLGRAIINKNGRTVVWLFGTLLAFLATSLVFWGLVCFVFGYRGGLFSVYESQLTGFNAKNLISFFKIILFSSVYFVLACGVAGFVYPAVTWRRWQSDKRFFWWYVIVSLVVMLIGSAWVVEKVKESNNIHLRYIASYIPLMLLFCFMGKQKAKVEAKSTLKDAAVPAASILIGWIALCIIVFGCKFSARSTNEHALLSIAFLHDDILPLSKQFVGTIIILVWCAAVCYLFLIGYKKKGFERICIVIMTVTMVLNGLMGYSLMKNSYAPEREKDGLEVHRLTEGKPFIFLLSHRNSSEYGIDVNTKQNNCFVYTNDFINCLEKNNGVYVPYIPLKMRGMKTVSETPNVDTLVIDYYSFPFFKFSEHVTVSSPYNRNIVLVVKFKPGERVVDSAISNLSLRTLSKGSWGKILLFNNQLLDNTMTIRLEIDSKVEQTMTIKSSSESHSVNLSPGKAWYQITFAHAEKETMFKAQDASISLSNYELMFDH